MRLFLAQWIKELKGEKWNMKSTLRRGALSHCHTAMYLKQLLVIASYTAGILAASSVAQEVMDGFSTLESTVDSLAQKIGASKTSLLSFSHIPGILTEVSGAMETLDELKDTAKFIPTGSVSYEECEDMVASARRMKGVIDASIKAAADHKSAAYTLPFVGSVVPVTKLALLHFQRTTEDLGATFVSKLPANCTTEVKSITEQLDDAYAAALASYST